MEGILTNPIVTGKTTFAGVAFAVEPVVTEEEYEGIKRQLAKNKRNARKKPERLYLVGGLLFCGRCGRRMYGRVKRDKRRGDYWWRTYFCASGIYPREDKRCGLRSVSVPKIESFVWSLAKKLLTDSDKLWAAVKARHMDISANDLITEDELKTYDRRLRQLEAEKSRVLSLYGKSEIITIEEVEQKVGEIKAEIAEVSADRQKHLGAKGDLEEKKRRLDEAVKHFKSIRSRLDDFSPEERKKLVDLLFSRLTLNWDDQTQEYKLDVEVQIPIFQDEEKDVVNTASFVLEELKGGVVRENIPIGSPENVPLLCKGDRGRRRRRAQHPLPLPADLLSLESRI